MKEILRCIQFNLIFFCFGQNLYSATFFEVIYISEILILVKNIYKTISWFCLFYRLILVLSIEIDDNFIIFINYV